MFRRAGLDECGKSRPPPGSDPQTARSVASHYTDRATTARGSHYGTSKRIGFRGTVRIVLKPHTIRAESAEFSCITEQGEDCGGET